MGSPLNELQRITETDSWDHHCISYFVRQKQIREIAIESNTAYNRNILLESQKQTRAFTIVSSTVYNRNIFVGSPLYRLQRITETDS